MSNSENQKEGSSEQISYVERFDKERAEWTEKISSIASRFKMIDNMVDVQVDLYSERQVATDYIHELTVLFSKLKKVYLTEWKKNYEALGLNEDFRYNEREKTKFADEKTSSSKLKMEILQNHIDFFRETVKTIDNMIFGVKHRLEIEDFRRGNK
jgi:hypothetical protein